MLGCMTRVRLRGVNFGGWLVLEKWMTPSLFAGTNVIDEYTFMHTRGATEKLRQHRATFITEDDFKWLRDNGLNALRLPIGYWIIEPDGPYKQGTQYVDWAFRMAEKYSLFIILDLHGAPGSQNGNDHSGRVGSKDWFTNKPAQKQTVRILKILHDRYKTSSSYWGIEVLNEPGVSPKNTTLLDFYHDATKTLDGPGAIVFHDCFRPRLASGSLSLDARAVMDVHLYHMASWAARFMSAQRFVRLSYWWWGRLLRRVRRTQPVIVGEWSCVLKGERLRRYSETYSRQLQLEFGSQQLKAYEHFADGWFYWNYKTEESTDLWNFRSLVEAGSLQLPE